MAVHIEKQFAALQHDAEQILNTISTLSKNLVSEGNGQVAMASREVMDAMRGQMDVAKKKIDETRAAVSTTARQMDANIHARPYPFILGALGAGALAGWLLERRMEGKGAACGNVSATKS